MLPRFCFSDSANAIDLIKSDLNVHHRFGNVIATIKRMLCREWECELHHTLREGNFATDYLIKMRSRNATSLSVFHEAPPNMTSILLADAMGVSFIKH